MREITFTVSPDVEDGGYVARWDDPLGGGITTQGDSVGDLEEMVADAVDGYFDGRSDRPTTVRLHFTEDPVLALT